MNIKDYTKKIRHELKQLVHQFPLCGLKGGTEIEDMTFKEIGHLQNICCEILPLIVKIGGPEARNDIRFLLKQGIDGILAPMVETPYSFSNFMNTIKDISSQSFHSFTIIAINIETLTAFHNQKEFEKNSLFKYITNITVGRTDLSASIGINAEDAKIYTITKEIIKRAKQFKKITSVGGKIDIENVKKIRDIISPDRINTRHVIFSLDYSQSDSEISKMIFAILQFEISLFRFFSTVHPEKKKFYDQRIQITLNRMNSSKGKLSA